MRVPRRRASRYGEAGSAFARLQAPPPLPVSSRGQDTWFSATGPGFESPYRYQLPCSSRKTLQEDCLRAELPTLFAIIRSCRFA